MTRSGAAFELPTSAPPTAASGSSSSPGLPTPTARLGDSRGAQGKRYLNPARSNDLDDAVDALVNELLPTPAVNDMGDNKTVEWWDAWTDRMKAEHGNGNGHGRSLAIEAMRLLPTPTAMDSAGSRGHRLDGIPYGPTSGMTLTDAAMSIGDATDPLSDGGST
jgi:hypothetical protein